MTPDLTDDRAAAALARLLHNEVDELSASSDGWDALAVRMARRRRLQIWTVALVTAVTVTALVAVTVPLVLDRRDRSYIAAGTSETSTEPIWPIATSAGGDWQRDARQTALRFLGSLGLTDTDLTTDGVSADRPDAADPLPIDQDGRTLVTVRASGGRAIAEVALRPKRGAPALWQVASVRSEGLSVRAPWAGVVFEPPLFVTFRSADDAEVVVRLYAVGRETPLTEWSDQVDGDADWTANANFSRTARGTPAYVSVTSKVHGVAAGVTVVPVTLGV